jgi:hypothetical protein
MPQQAADTMPHRMAVSKKSLIFQPSKRRAKVLHLLLVDSFLRTTNA